jgi:hypothetical protein
MKEWLKLILLPMKMRFNLESGTSGRGFRKKGRI